MGMISTSEAAVIAGLRSFLARFTVLRPTSSIVVPSVGLANFLDKAHPLLHRARADLPIIARLETTARRPVLPGAMPSSEAAVIAGLRRFLARFTAQRPASPIVVPHAGLANFLDKARPLLHREPAVVPVITAAATPNPQRLSAALASIHLPLRLARANGEFLQVWSVAGLKRSELRNAAVLAWLIDPSGSHGHGPAIIRGLLQVAAEQVPSWPLRGVDLSHIRVHTEECPLVP
jgi:hypothetical protein